MIPILAQFYRWDKKLGWHFDRHAWCKCHWCESAQHKPITIEDIDRLLVDLKPRSEGASKLCLDTTPTE